MAKYRIDHDRPNCIGCAACAAVLPENWKMNEDGKSDVINPEFEEKDFERNKEAADCCPVNVIHIINNENKKRVI